MKTSRINTLIMNIGTVIIAVGILVVGYWVFVKKQSVIVPGTGATATITERTIVEGVDLARTIKEVSDLNSAVLASVSIFNKQSFQGLKDFSLKVPEEPIGRNNPFTPTDWKIRSEK